MPDPSAHSDHATVTLLIAHGSRNPAAGAEHEEMCRQVAERAAESTGVRPDVRPAYLEISSPSIADAIDTAVAGGATAIKLLPHFLYSGNHVLVDIPAIAATARDRHPGVDITLSEHSGADAAVVDLLAARVVD